MPITLYPYCKRCGCESYSTKVQGFGRYGWVEYECRECGFTWSEAQED